MGTLGIKKNVNILKRSLKTFQITKINFIEIKIISGFNNVNREKILSCVNGNKKNIVCTGTSGWY